MTDLGTLRAIGRSDPDGDETRTSAPTEDDHRRFEAWVRDTYGERALRDYLAGDWEPQPEV